MANENMPASLCEKRAAHAEIKMQKAHGAQITLVGKYETRVVFLYERVCSVSLPLMKMFVFPPFHGELVTSAE